MKYILKFLWKSIILSRTYIIIKSKISIGLIQTLEHITLGRYIPKTSRIHQLDPRTKLIVSGLWMMNIFIVHSLYELLLMSVLICGFYWMAQLPLKMAFGTIRPFLWLFLLTMGIHFFSTPGHPIAQIPWIKWTMTSEGLERGFYYTVRVILLIIFASLLTLTTSPFSITLAIEKLIQPLRKLNVPVQDIAMMLSIAMRFIPILIDESIRIKKAQMARGARFDGNLIQRIKSVFPIVIPLFISAFRKAHDLALAMDSRCYQSGKTRTSYDLLRWKQGDVFAMGFSGISLIILCLINFKFD